MEILKQPGGCLMIKHSLEELSKPYLLISDVHLDNPACDKKLLTKHLNEAKDRGAGILCFGDFFDAMQGRRDRRANKSDLLTEHKAANYFDTLVYTAAEFLEPYRDNLVLLTMGNHESSVVQNAETNLLERLVRELDCPTTFLGDYQGFIRFQHLVTATSRRTTTLYWHHGNWGGVVSRGTQSTARFASVTPDADIVVSGHTHSRWLMPHAQFKLSQNGTTQIKSQFHVKIGGYKGEFTKNNGWAIEKLVLPGDLGGWWLTFERNGEELIPNFTMTV